MSKKPSNNISSGGIKIIAQNRKAYFNYEIVDKFESGLVLLGSEVKALRLGKCSISESYIDKTSNMELELINSSIPPFQHSTFAMHEDRRARKLLLHKKEIIKILNDIAKKGYTAVPLKLYFKQGKVKAEIGVAKGKNNYDKRQDIKNKDLIREQSKTFKNYNVKL